MVSERALLALAAVLGAMTAYKLHMNGLFTKLEDLGLDSCHSLPTPSGGGFEDGERISDYGLSLWTSDNRSAFYPTTANRARGKSVRDLLAATPQGAVFAIIDPVPGVAALPQVVPVPLVGLPTTVAFHPLGLATTPPDPIPRQRERVGVYIVSRRPTEDVIEEFEFVPTQHVLQGRHLHGAGVGAGGVGVMQWVRTLRHPLLHNLNDVAIAPPHARSAAGGGGVTLYASQWSRSALDGPFAVPEAMLMLPTTRVFRCEWPAGAAFGDCRVAASGLVGANGMAFDAAANTVYVVECSGRRVSAYRHSAEPMAELEYLDYASTGVSLCDNLSLGTTSNMTNVLVLACHPSGVKVVGHLHDPAQAAPSEVRIVPLTRGAGAAAGAAFASRETTRVWMDAKGARLSGSSGALLAGGRLIVGAVLDPRVAVCSAPV